MKKQLASTLTAVLVAGALLFPLSADAFTLTASDFNGFVAYDRAGDVVSRYGLDPRFSYENTGQRFNTAATVDFKFNYVPSSPTLHDIMASPNTKYKWTVGISGLDWPELPTPGYGMEDRVFTNFKDAAYPPVQTGASLPGFSFSGVASFNDMKNAAGSAWSVFTGFFPTEGAYLMDLDWETGTGSLAMAANIDYGMLGAYLPKMFMQGFASGAELTITAEPIPEPLTMVLFGAGLAGVGLIRRRNAMKS